MAPKKKQKTAELQTGPVAKQCNSMNAYGISQHAFARVVKHLKSNRFALEDLPESYPGWKHRGATELRTMAKELGEKQLLLSNGIIWHVPSLSCLIDWHLQNNCFFMDLMEQVLETHALPSGLVQLHLITYCDEFTPGNVLAPDVKKKTNNWYCSVAELGPALGVEHVWMHMASLISTKVEGLTGGWSAVTRCLMESYQSECPNFASGITVRLRGKTFLLQFEIGPNIWDEKGLKEVWFIKGSGGKRPCLQCGNLAYKHMSERLPPGMITICEPDANKFSQVTDDEVYAMFDTLESIADRPSKLDETEVNCGLKYDPSALLASQQLRGVIKPTDNRYDMCHTHFSSGIAEVEINLMLAALRNDKVLSNHQVQVYLQADWRDGYTCRPVYTKVKDDELKTDATGHRKAVHIIRQLVDQVLVHKKHEGEPWRPDILESFQALHDSICQMEFMIGTRSFSDVHCDTLQRLQRTHLELFLQAYGPEKCKPKHHMSLHLPKQVKEDRFLLHAFPLEHKHKLSKDIMEKYHNANLPDMEMRLCCKSALHQKTMIDDLQKQSGICLRLCLC